MRKVLMTVSLLLMIALLAFLVPDSALMPGAYGEEVLPQIVPMSLKTAVAPLPLEGDAPYAPHADGYTTEPLGYHDDTLDIQIQTMRAYNTTITVTYIQLSNATQLRTKQAKPYPSKASTRPDVLAKRVNAVLAINADYFVYHNYGIVYRQGELLRNKPNKAYDALIIDRNGDFHIVKPLTAEGFAAIDVPVLQSFCFGPALVMNGEIQEINTLKTNSPDRRTQRMAISQLSTLTYMAVTTEGPDDEGSTGLTLPELAQLMSDLGARDAYNLDGGSSACVILNGKKINTKRTLRIRAVGDIIYFATAEE